MRLRRTILALLLCAAGASACSKKSSGAPPPVPPAPPGQPTVDVPPASLGASGIVVEQPAQGESLEGTWVTVAGWVDPKRWATVLVMGAPAEHFYQPSTGHMGVPTVPVLVRPDGRFVAPRVPLQEGDTEIDVIPLGAVATRAPPETVRLHVTARHTDQVPATAIARPSSGPAPLTTTLQAMTTLGNLDWEWDFDGDGTFDAVAPGGSAITHVYDRPGSHLALARAKRGDRWIYAVTSATVAADSQVLDATTSVTDPRALSVVTDVAGWYAARNDEGLADAGDDTLFTRSVLVCDGDSVKVFDAHLRPMLTVGGLSHPGGVAGDSAGRIYVADTGNNRIVRFNADGGLDSTFGNAGALSAIGDGGSFTSPTSLALGYWGDRSDLKPALLVVDQGTDRLVLCSDEPVQCAPVFPAVALDGAPAAGTAKLSALGAVGGLEALLHSQGGLFPVVVSDQTRVLGWSVTEGRNRFNVLASPGSPMVSLSAVPARELRGLDLIAGADASGHVHGWIAGSSSHREVREEHLPYAVHALAFDAYASEFRAQVWRTSAGVSPGLESGPTVIYVAGPGHLERRVLSSMEVLPW